MSDRKSVGRRCSGFAFVCTILMLWAGGCERGATASQSHVQTTAADRSEPVAGEPSKPIEPAPLLLEEEPAEEASGGPVADNSRCFVCHVNYMQEKLAVTHANANIGCARCHGASDAHIADESWASGDNGTAPDHMYPRDKINAACMACHSKDKIDTPQHQAVLMDASGQKACTDCHGNHRLPQRRCKWK